ncbi:MAG TPA: hypothetical protein VFC11_03910, partial [Methylocella sp.]|nr:hypothetical protein [Methylocella sp.]
MTPDHRCVAKRLELQRLEFRQYRPLIFQKKNRATKRRNIPLPKIFERPKQVWHRQHSLSSGQLGMSCINPLGHVR